MENITDLSHLTIAELLAFLAKQDRYNPKSGMCTQLVNARFNGAINRRHEWAIKAEINSFLAYISLNWEAPQEVYLRDAIFYACRISASYKEIDQLCREIYLNWNDRLNLVNDFINNHRWGN